LTLKALGDALVGGCSWSHNKSCLRGIHDFN
jgi:hypothetical protein